MPTNSKKSKRVWMHNSFFGHAAMGKAHMTAIIYSDTTTAPTKATANKIRQLLQTLEMQLKERVDANPR